MLPSKPPILIDTIVSAHSEFHFFPQGGLVVWVTFGVPLMVESNRVAGVVFCFCCRVFACDCVCLLLDRKASVYTQAFSERGGEVSSYPDRHPVMPFISEVSS